MVKPWPRAEPLLENGKKKKKITVDVERRPDGAGLMFSPPVTDDEEFNFDRELTERPPLPQRKTENNKPITPLEVRTKSERIFFLDFLGVEETKFYHVAGDSREDQNYSRKNSRVNGGSRSTRIHGQNANYLRSKSTRSSSFRLLRKLRRWSSATRNRSSAKGTQSSTHKKKLSRTGDWYRRKRCPSATSEYF